MSVEINEHHGSGSSGTATLHKFEMNERTGLVSSTSHVGDSSRWDVASVRISSIVDVFRVLFLPRGEISQEYIRFQLLDSVQAMCSYLRGVLTIHATLSGIGAATGSEAAAAATIAFILKDGSAMLGSLGFNYIFASRFDGDLRFWRLFADLVNDVGLTLELLAPLTGPHFFLFTTCTANVCKALCGVAAGATRVAISMHFAEGGMCAHPPTTQRHRHPPRWARPLPN